jgi:CHAD domain-containing protein
MELDYVKLKPIKPALAGYIREAQIMLKESGITDEKTVHDVRVLMKKSRAVLKLVAPQLDKESVTRDITALREVGRIMCSMRETSVQRKTLKEFRKKYPDIFSRLNENKVLAALLEKHTTDTEPTEELKTAGEQVDSLISKTGYRIRFQSMNTINPQLLIKELENTYTMIVDIYLLCRNNPKKAMLHRLRKKTKDFLYQLYIFRPLNPTVIKALEKKLDIIAQNLGKFNDIAQIIRALDYKYPEGSKVPAMDELIIRFRETQDKYLAKVWPAAFQVFCPGQKLLNILGFRLLVI